MKYTLTVENEDEVIVNISSFSLESLEEQIHKVEYAVKKYEGEQEVRAQSAFDSWQEEEAERIELEKVQELEKANH